MPERRNGPPATLYQLLYTMSCEFLILGLAAGYHHGDVRPFLQSLRETAFSGRVLLFVSPTTRDLERMAAHGAEIVPFQRPKNLEHVPYNAWRYFLYRDFLRQETNRYARIMLSDVRDVIFQRDPSTFPWPRGHSFFLEDLRMRVGDCPHMTRWIRGHLGDHTLETLRREHISCSGVTVADHESMLGYLESLTARLLPFSPAKGMAGYDQAVHNLLIRQGAFPHMQAHDNSGPVLTLGYKTEGAPLSESGEMLNDSGRPAHVVHQYDRHPELFALIRRRYS